MKLINHHPFNTKSFLTLDIRNIKGDVPHRINRLNHETINERKIQPLFYSVATQLSKACFSHTSSIASTNKDGILH
jgi:hypothetical protein